MTKIRAEIEVPNDEYCESADNVCPMCLGQLGKILLLPFWCRLRNG